MFLSSLAKRLFQALLVSAATQVPSFAGAIIDFESSAALVNAGDNYQQSGFKFTPSGGDALVDASFCSPTTEFCAVGNNTSYLSALNDAEVTLVHVSRVFSVSSFDGSYVPTPFLDPSGLAVRLVLTGTQVGGTVFAQTFNLVEGLQGNFNFSINNLSSDFGLLTSLTFSACFDTGTSCERGGQFLNSAQFAIDNLAVDIPEPSVLWLTALGFGALALSRRNRRVSSNGNSSVNGNAA
jgi:hypothetical protein